MRFFRSSEHLVPDENAVVLNFVKLWCLNKIYRSYQKGIWNLFNHKVAWDISFSFYIILIIRKFQQVLFIIFYYSLGQCKTSFSSPQLISITSWFISGLYNNDVADTSGARDQVYFDSRSSARENKELNCHRREKHIQNKVTFLNFFF